MHTIKLYLEDDIYHNIMFLLKNLNLQGLSIEEEITNRENSTTKENITQLFESKKVTVFKKIDDPMKWQKEQRDEWQ